MSEKLDSKLSDFVKGVGTAGISEEESKKHLYDYIIQADNEGESTDPENFGNTLEEKGFGTEVADLYSAIYSTGMKVLKRKSQTA